MADVGVLQLTIRDNSESAGKGLDSLGDALVRVKHAVTGGLGLSSVSKEIANLSRTVQAACETNGVVKNLNEVFKAVNQFGKLKGFSLDGDKLRDYAKSMTSLAEAQDRIVESAKQTGKDGNYWDNMLGNSEAKKAIDGAQDNLKSLKGLIKEVKDSGSTELANAWGKQASRGRSSSQRSEGQIEMDLDSLLKKTETVTETVTQEYKEMIGAVEKTPLDFTKFDPSDLPLSALGMTVEQYRNGKREALEFADAVKSAETVVLSMKAKADAARFDENENKAIILYQENMENSWERICNRMGSANDELEEYVKHQKEVIFGNESIQGLWENPNIGPSLQGFFGTETQTAMIEKIAEATGLSTDNIVEQLYKLSNGMVDLRKTAETVSDSAAVQRVKDDIAGIGIESEDAISKIQLLNNKIEHLWGVYNRLSEMPEIDEMGNPTGRNNAMNNVLLQIGSAYEQLDRLIDKAHEAQDAMQFDQMKASAAEAIEQRPQWSQQDVSNLVENYTEVDLLEMKLRGLQQALMDDINQNKLDTQQIADRTIAIQNLQDRIDELKDSQEEATESTRSFGESFKDFKKGLKDAFPLLNNLAKKLKGIIIKRTLTAAVKKIAAGAKEGLQNVYEYSKMIGSSFAPSMDSAASAIAQMKNSLGAALAPALQAIIPLLQQLVNGFISVVNWVNQLFSLLNGQKTWTRALPQTTSAFEKQTKAAKKTGAAIKDLLADWDELNIIQSQTSGGGGTTGTAAEDYLAMFEEVNRFDNRIQDIVDFIKDNFGWMLTAVAGIGAAIKLWRISDGFEHSLGMLQKLELAAGLTLIITGIKLTADAGYDIGKNGINGENAIDAVGGVLSTMIGGGLTGLAFAGIEGGLVGLTVGAALGLTVLAIGINEGHLDALYGDVKLDVDEIVKDLEENVLKSDASLEINVINANIKDIGDAETKVATSLLDLAKSYPVNVDITLDDAEGFLSKVNTLVDDTNALIAERQETMKKITVPSMAVFGPNFVDDAWGGISSYVTELGTQIGEELSKSTVDAVKLDDLRKKLMEMSMVIMNAQKSSEFTGAVSMISEGIRNSTRLGKYDRQTVETYVEEYNKLLQNAKNTASDEALQEYVSAFTLVQSLETKQRQMGEAFDQVDELEKAKKVLAEMGEEADYVAKRAEEMYDEWTRAGRQVYGNIIAGALKTAISNNDWNDSYYQRQLEKDTAPREREIQDTDAWVRHYIGEQYKDLYNIISINSGMAMDQVKKLLESSDINPLSLLDENFVEQYRNKIIEWLGKSPLDDSRRRTILEAFGLNFDEVEFENEVEKAIEETVKDAKVEPEVTVEPKLAYEIDLTNENDLYREINALIDNEGIFGKDRSGMSNLLLRLKWDSKVDDLKKIYDYILQNQEDHGATTWYDWYNQENGNTGNAMNAARFIGMNNTVSDVGFGKYDATPSDPSKIGDVWGVIDTVTKRLDEMQDKLTREDMAKAVESGTKNANRDQEDIVRSILSGVNALLRKNWTVNVNATSSLGMVNRASAAKVGKITGHSYML